jgi:hypothetical protein
MRFKVLCCEVMDDQSTRTKISPSLFALNPVPNLPRKPIEDLRAKIVERYRELLAEPQEIPSNKSES